MAAMVCAMSGCSKRDKETSTSDSPVINVTQTDGTDSSSNGNADSQDENQAQSGEDEGPITVMLKGTKFSWVVPEGFNCKQNSKGFAGVHEEEKAAIYGKRLSLNVIDSEYSQGNRIPTDVLKSRVWDLAFTAEYQVTEGQVRDIAVDGQNGILFEGSYQTSDGSNCKMSVFAMQYDNDVVMVVLSQDADSTINAFDVLNTVSISKVIHT